MFSNMLNQKDPITCHCQKKLSEKPGKGIYCIRKRLQFWRKDYCDAPKINRMACDLAFNFTVIRLNSLRTF